jgi:hypothetical protein
MLFLWGFPINTASAVHIFKLVLRLSPPLCIWTLLWVGFPLHTEAQNYNNTYFVGRDCVVGKATAVGCTVRRANFSGASGFFSFPHSCRLALGPTQSPVEWVRRHSAEKKICRRVRSLSMSENRVLRRVFGPKRDEVTGNGESYIMRSWMICIP